MAQRIILASGSQFRRSLLQNAGVTFEVVRADIDERAVEDAMGSDGVAPEDVAQVLAEAKATDVSEKHREAIVIGADQTLSLGDRIFHKPVDMEDARRHILALSGGTHQLNSAIALVRNGETLWRHVSVAHLTMRYLEPAYIGRHLAAAGSSILQSVGAYQIEGPGIQLFEKIDGDYFTIVGLPLLPLLGELRKLGAIDG